MAEFNDLISAESDGSLSFGNYMLHTKQKLDAFDFDGDIYKVKTFSELTRLEKNEAFVYESVPGTEVSEFKADMECMDFLVEGAEDAQITVGLEEETEYRIYIDDVAVGKMRTGLGGKLSVYVELEPGDKVHVVIRK